MSDANPAMLVLGREARGLTQVELARRIGVAQGTVSKVEHGLLAPSQDLVGLYAQVLDYPVTFFHQTFRQRSLPVTFYRKRASVGATTIKKIEANLNVMREHVAKLLQSAAIPKLRVPQVKLSDYDGALEDLAGELRAQWNVPRGPIMNLTRLVEDLGVIIVRYDFESGFVDGISVYDPEDHIPPIVFVNPSIPGDRLRFTLAHELAHIVLHHHMLLPTVDCEAEANQFASAFLMPASDIRGQMRAVKLDALMNLKTYWRTSLGALIMRAESLGKISDSQSARLWATMSKMGYRRREPIDIPRDEPTLIAEIVKFHITDLGYSDMDLKAVLSWHAHEIRRTYLGAPAGLRLVK